MAHAAGCRGDMRTVWTTEDHVIVSNPDMFRVGRLTRKHRRVRARDRSSRHGAMLR